MVGKAKSILQVAHIHKHALGISLNERIWCAQIRAQVRDRQPCGIKGSKHELGAIKLRGIIQQSRTRDQATWYSKKSYANKGVSVCPALSGANIVITEAYLAPKVANYRTRTCGGHVLPTICDSQPSIMDRQIKRDLTHHRGDRFYDLAFTQIDKDMAHL